MFRYPDTFAFEYSVGYDPLIAIALEKQFNAGKVAWIVRQRDFTAGIAYSVYKIYLNPVISKKIVDSDEFRRFAERVIGGDRLLAENDFAVFYERMTIADIRYLRIRIAYQAGVDEQRVLEWTSAIVGYLGQF
jgi:hypothetical protein